MKRKFWPAAMTALMALLLTCGFAACADTGDTGNDNPDTPEEPLQATEGLVFTLSQDGTEYFVTDYTGTAAEVYVPATHEGLPVTTIRHYGDGDAFAYCKQLTSVTLPDSITSIGRRLPGLLAIDERHASRQPRQHRRGRVRPLRKPCERHTPRKPCQYRKRRVPILHHVNEHPHSRRHHVHRRGGL